MSASKPITAAVTALLAATLVALAYATALMSAGEYPYRLFDGDFVHPFLLVRDLATGGSLFDWVSSAALYAFPDWLFALTALLPIDGRVAIVLASLLLLGAFALAGGLLLGTALGLTPTPAIILYGAGLVLITLVAGRPIQWLLNYAASIYIHTGATLMLLVAIGLAAQVLVRGRAPIALPVLCAITVATVYSDPIFLVWFVAPLAATAGLLALVARQPRRLLAPGLVSLLGVAAYLAERVKPFPSSQAELFAVSPLDAAREFFRVLGEGLADGDGALFAYSLAALVSIVLLLATIGELFARRSVSERQVQTLLLTLSTLAVLVLPILVGAIDHPSKLRYMIAIVYLAPLLLLPPPLRLLRAGRLRLLAGGVGLALGVLALWLSPSLLTAFRTGQHAPLIACLEQRGLTDGYADYDYAKSVIFLSGGAIHLSQAGLNTHINFTARWRDRRTDGEPFRPNFVLTANLPADYLERFGTPDEIMACPGDHQVWIYQRQFPPTSCFSGLTAVQALTVHVPLAFVPALRPATKGGVTIGTARLNLQSAIGGPIRGPVFLGRST
ncbi:hypothetical protein [Devosia sp. RR2S18]|uniref:hypothetical protein n=1 Tax=Devosia rhizosphaerae TaxID=3049774 RepID=UPI002540C761|nr:hypothetical protein [Devosia sp. RR2S18]WIJ24022.1 hypothetical protein QOV41_13450 [Devosia sp. RR2S18]